MNCSVTNIKAVCTLAAAGELIAHVKKNRLDMEEKLDAVKAAIGNHSCHLCAQRKKTSTLQIKVKLKKK